MTIAIALTCVLRDKSRVIGGCLKFLVYVTVPIVMILAVNLVLANYDTIRLRRHYFPALTTISIMTMSASRVASGRMANGSMASCGRCIDRESSLTGRDDKCVRFCCGVSGSCRPRCTSSVGATISDFRRQLSRGTSAGRLGIVLVKGALEGSGTTCTDFVRCYGASGGFPEGACIYVTSSVGSVFSGVNSCCRRGVGGRGRRSNRPVVALNALLSSCAGRVRRVQWGFRGE